MALVRFTQNIQRHIACPPREVTARTVREALHEALNPTALGYFLDDQAASKNGL